MGLVKDGEFGLIPAKRLVLYRAVPCGVTLPRTGHTQAYRVMRITASGSEIACAAVFVAGPGNIGKEMAEKYIEYLMQNGIEVV